MTQRERFADAGRVARPDQRFRANAFAAPDAGRAIVHVGANQHRVVAQRAAQGGYYVGHDLPLSMTVRNDVAE
jgi:hypothetical protein